MFERLSTNFDKLLFAECVVGAHVHKAVNIMCFVSLYDRGMGCENDLVFGFFHRTFEGKPRRHMLTNEFKTSKNSMASLKW